jgi:hypothetical protein
MAESNHELGALHARVDMILSGQMRLEDRLETVRSEILETLEALSRRVATLEWWQGWMMGGLALAGLLVGVAVSVWGWGK